MFNESWKNTGMPGNGGNNPFDTKYRKFDILIYRVQKVQYFDISCIAKFDNSICCISKVRHPTIFMVTPPRRWDDCAEILKEVQGTAIGVGRLNSVLAHMIVFVFVWFRVGFLLSFQRFVVSDQRWSPCYYISICNILTDGKQPQSNKVHVIKIQQICNPFDTYLV